MVGKFHIIFPSQPWTFFEGHFGPHISTFVGHSAFRYMSNTWYLPRIGKGTPLQRNNSSFLRRSFAFLGQNLLASNFCIYHIQNSCFPKGKIAYYIYKGLLESTTVFLLIPNGTRVHSP